MVPALDGYDMDQQGPAGRKGPAVAVAPAGIVLGLTDPAAAAGCHHQTRISCVDLPLLRVLPLGAAPRWKAAEGVDQMGEEQVALGYGRAPSLAADGSGTASAGYNMLHPMPASSDQLGNILKKRRKDNHLFEVNYKLSQMGGFKN